MPYDVFISYSRRENEEGRIKQLVERIETDFAAFAGRPLVPFFDASEIHGMDDWRHRILQGLRESRLLLACLSPAYLQSEYCEWEVNEYLKHEIGRAYFGDGVAPIYFVQVPGWEDRGFEQQCAAWVAELRRRQHFDFRPWFRAGEESLRDTTVRERMRQLNAQLKERITRGERAEHSLGNMDAHNPHFIGRTTELRRLRETVALGKVGVLTAVHGLGGVGKTALAIEYAHAFAHEYGGGRWQVRCEGKEDLHAAIAELAAPLALEFNENEKKNIDLQFQRVLAELHRIADTHEPNRCLLLLDNVDKPRLLGPAQAQRLPSGEWLHVIATTRLGETDLFGRHKDRAFLPVDELPEVDAIELIETYQPNSTFPNDAEREAARAIVNLLDRFTLAVESAAVYLGQFSEDVACAGFLDRLRNKGLEELSNAANQSSEAVRHGEMCLTATLAPSLERLSEPEQLALSYAALLPADHIPLSWIRALVADRFSEYAVDAEPGCPDPWRSLLRHVLSLRIWQSRDPRDINQLPLMVRMHRVVQEVTSKTIPANRGLLFGSLALHAWIRSDKLQVSWQHQECQWEIEPLTCFVGHALECRKPESLRLVEIICRWLPNVDLSDRPLNLLRESILLEDVLPGLSSREKIMTRNALGWALRQRGLLSDAERILREALSIGLSEKLCSDLEYATSLNNLAKVLLTALRAKDALPLFWDALTTYRAAQIQDQLTIATILNNIGDCLIANGDLAEAKTVILEGLSLRTEQLGDEHPYVAVSHTSLARLHLVSARYKEAYQHADIAINILTKSTCETGHIRTANAMQVRAEAERFLGNYDIASTAFEEARRIRSSLLPSGHPDLEHTLSCLSEINREKP